MRNVSKLIDLVCKSFELSLSEAYALILAGRIIVNEQRVDKPGTMVTHNSKIRIKIEK